MKSLLRILEEMIAIWLICLLAGSSCAVFYTKSSDNDYPRIGRRAFFTGGIKGSSYPRIGRRSSPIGMHGGAASFDADYLSPSKRGIFTTGERNFPRIGRSETEVERSRGLPDTPAEMTSAEEPEVVGSEEETGFDFPVELLFFSFDKNVDKMLSREEFVEGMNRAREDGTICR